MDRNEIAEHIGGVIRDTRRRLGMSLNDYSDLIGSKPTTIGSWERGERLIPLDELINLAAKSGATPLELLATAFAVFEDEAVLTFVRVEWRGGGVTVLGQLVKATIDSNDYSPRSLEGN